MTFLFVLFLGWTFALLVAGIIEQRTHHKALHSIPTRVLVNGIRGKSSITRLCAGALRGGGKVVVAKTTGTAARFIYPDASEEPVHRKFNLANVIEQVGIVRRAALFHPDALVIECMAVDPELQEINQAKLIQSTIGVLCNVREDHLAEMGPTLDHVARSLSRSMPVGGVCVTAERDRLEILQQEAKKRRCRLIAVDPESVTDAEMSGFPWITFKENVAIAIAVARLCGVSRADALAGMWAAPPDPGVLAVKHYHLGGKSFRLANVFAANDPSSTLMNIDQLLGIRALAAPLNVIINCRPDRVERNGQMGSIVADIAPERVFLIGEPTRSARATIDDKWLPGVVDLGGSRRIEEIAETLVATLDDHASLVAIGNIHGQGESLLDYLEEFEVAMPRRAVTGPHGPRMVPHPRGRREMPSHRPTRPPANWNR